MISDGAPFCEPGGLYAVGPAQSMVPSIILAIGCWDPEPTLAFAVDRYLRLRMPTSGVRAFLHDHAAGDGAADWPRVDG